MAPIATLGQGAVEAYPRMFARYGAGTIATNFRDFIDALALVFPDDGSADERTAANWIVVGRALINAGVASLNGNFDFFNQAVDLVYRLCMGANNANFATPQRITNAQATAIVAAYNANLQ